MTYIIDRMKNPIENIIDFAGSLTNAARLLKATPQRVNNWRTRGMPKGEQLVAIENGIPKHIVRPDLFEQHKDKDSEL